MSSATPFPPTKIASIKANEPPSHSWEVAYIYAFLHKFLHEELTDFSNTKTILTSPMAIEEALLACSPKQTFRQTPAPTAAKASTSEKKRPEVKRRASSSSLSSLSSASVSSLSDLDDGGDSASEAEGDAEKETPSPSPVILQILQAFRGNLPGPSTKAKDTLFVWLKRIVQGEMELDDPSVRTEEAFWRARWHHKARLLRKLVDYQLAYAQPVRDKLIESYDLRHQRVIKRSKEVNPLVVDPLGAISHGRFVHALDDSPRLYYSTSPYKNGGWQPICDTFAEYETFVADLKGKSTLQTKVVASGSGSTSKGGPWERMRQAKESIASMKKANDKATAKAAKKGKEKDIGDVVDWEAKERQTKRALEARMETVSQYQARLDALEAKKQAEIDKQKKREQRVNRELAALSYHHNPVTRSNTAAADRRLRETKTTNYVFDNEMSDDDAGLVASKQDEETQDFEPSQDVAMTKEEEEDEYGEAPAEEDHAVGERRSRRLRDHEADESEEEARPTRRLRSQSKGYSDVDIDAVDDEDAESTSDEIVTSTRPTSVVSSPATSLERTEAMTIDEK